MQGIASLFLTSSIKKCTLIVFRMLVPPAQRAKCCWDSDEAHYGNKGRDTPLLQRTDDADLPARIEGKLSESPVLAGAGGNLVERRFPMYFLL